MSEIFEPDEIPSAASGSGSSGAGSGSGDSKTISNDKHLPNFEFD
jgi:hypothetical protein